MTEFLTDKELIELPVDLEQVRFIFPYFNNNHTANLMLQLAEEQKDMISHFVLTSLMFRMFAMEAYLNHIGENFITDWIEKDSFWNKLEIICNHFMIDKNLGHRPFSTLNLLVQFRNEIAHGKNDTKKRIITMPLNKAISLMQDNSSKSDKWGYTKAEKFCTLKNALKAKEDIEKIIRAIHKIAGYDTDPLNKITSVQSMIK